MSGNFVARVATYSIGTLLGFGLGLVAFHYLPSGFFVGVVQTALGSLAGFALGLVAFHYQQLRLSKDEDERGTKAALQALNRLNNSAGTNIESLAELKHQHISALRAEVDQVNDLTEQLFKAPDHEKGEITGQLVELSSSLRVFFLALQSVPVMQPPAYVEYSRLDDEVPALSLFVHRAEAMTIELNERIRSRNGLVSEFARENGGGMNQDRLFYFLRMLGGDGDAICLHVEYAIGAWKLVLDQIAEYAGTQGGDLEPYELKIGVADELPTEEHHPVLRSKIARFAN